MIRKNLKKTGISLMTGAVLLSSFGLISVNAESNDSIQEQTELAENKAVSVKNVKRIKYVAGSLERSAKETIRNHKLPSGNHVFKIFIEDKVHEFSNIENKEDFINQINNKSDLDIEATSNTNGYWVDLQAKKPGPEGNKISFTIDGKDSINLKDGAYFEETVTGEFNFTKPVELDGSGKVSIGFDESTQFSSPVSSNNIKVSEDEKKCYNRNYIFS